MPLYRYEATDSKGQTVYGVLSAHDENELRDELGSRGYRLVAVHSTGDQASVTPRRPRLRANAASKALLFRQLASLSRAGISPYAALADLGARLTDPALKSVCIQMSETVRAGQTLSEAMEQYPSLFPAHIVATVRAGETGGFLDIALDEIGLEYEQEVAFYKGVWLPKALVLQAILAIALAQPLFPTLFPNNQLNRYLALVFLRNIPIAVAFVLAVRAMWSRLRRPENAERRDRWTLSLPVFGDLSRQRSLAAFIRMLRRLYGAGLMPTQAWEGATYVVANSVIRERLKEASNLMQQGLPLHEAFRATGLFTSEVEQLIATGVVSGEVIEMLDRVAEYYQRNLEHAFEQSRFWMFRLALALFMALSGLVVILMAKTYFDAVFNFTKGWTE